MTTNIFRYRGRVIRFCKLSSGAAFAALAILATDVTFAQGSGNDEAVDEIIITGSRIPRSGFETLQPATVLDATRRSRCVHFLSSR